MAMHTREFSNINSLIKKIILR